MDTFMTVLHVVAGVFVIGPLAILPMSSLRLIRGGETERVRASAKPIRLLSYLSLIVAVTGFGAVGLADPKYDLSVTTPWVLWSIVLYVVALVVTLFVVVPALEHVGAPVNAGHAAATRTAEGTKDPAYGKVAAGSGIASLALIVVVVLMVWKP